MNPTPKLIDCRRQYTGAAHYQSPVPSAPGPKGSKRRSEPDAAPIQHAQTLFQYTNSATRTHITHPTYVSLLRNCADGWVMLVVHVVGLALGLHVCILHHLQAPCIFTCETCSFSRNALACSTPVRHSILEPSKLRTCRCSLMSVEMFRRLDAAIHNVDCTPWSVLLSSLLFLASLFHVLTVMHQRGDSDGQLISVTYS